MLPKLEVIDPASNAPTVVIFDVVSRLLSAHVSKSAKVICFIVPPSLIINLSDVAIVTPVEAEVSPSMILSSAPVVVIVVPFKLIASKYATPSKYRSLNSDPLEPISNASSVDGVILVAAIVSCCAGPSLVIAPPSADVPSCVCPDVLKAVTMASNSPSKSDALIMLPSAILLAVSLRVYPVPMLCYLLACVAYSSVNASSAYGTSVLLSASNCADTVFPDPIVCAENTFCSFAP